MWNVQPCASAIVAGQPQRKQEQEDGLGAVLPAVVSCMIVVEQWWGGFRVKLSQTFQEQPVTRPLQVTVTDGYKLVDTAEFWRPRGRECHSNVLAVTYHYNPLHIIKTHFLSLRMNTSIVWGLKTTKTTLNGSLLNSIVTALLVKCH